MITLVSSRAKPLKTLWHCVRHPWAVACLSLLRIPFRGLFSVGAKQVTKQHLVSIIIDIISGGEEDCLHVCNFRVIQPGMGWIQQ